MRLLKFKADFYGTKLKIRREFIGLNGVKFSNENMKEDWESENIEMFNEALLLKWNWKFLQDDNAI